MKKLLTIGAALAVISFESLHSQDLTNYMTFKYGLSSLEDNFSLNQHSFGGSFIADTGYVIEPKLDITYVSVNNIGGVDYLFQTALNGFIRSRYTYQSIAPYLYGGIGYEYVGGGTKYFDSNFYIQEGAGLEIPISAPEDNLHIITEIRLMQMIGAGNGQDGEASFFIGLRLPFARPYYSSNAISSAPIKSSRQYAELEDSLPDTNEDRYNIEPPVLAGDGRDNVVLQASQDVVDQSSNKYYSDSDGDGVADSVDECPDTPRNRVVDARGCAIDDKNLYKNERKYRRVDPIVKLKPAGTFKTLPSVDKVLDVHFSLNSDHIEKPSRPVILRFVQAVNKTGFNKIIINGYTDNTGVFEKNLELSRKRAQAVKNVMVQYGIDSDKIEIHGKGSLNPISSNDTPEGRAKNRRIEVIVR